MGGWNHGLCARLCWVMCGGVCFVLSVLDIFGEMLWPITSCYYERLSVESRVLDRGAPPRCRRCCCCWRLIFASSYYTEKRVVLGLGVWIVWRCFIMYVRCCCRAEASPAACCGRTVLCALYAVRCATLLWKYNAQKPLLPNNTSSMLYVLGRKKKLPMYLIFGKKDISRWSLYILALCTTWCLVPGRFFFSNLTQISRYIFSS